MPPVSEPVVWTRRLLRAAYWVTRVLGSTGKEPAEARDLWTSLPLAGEVDLVELRAAEEGLRGARLLSLDDGRLVPAGALYQACASPGPVPLELLLGVVLEAAPPLWLLTAGTNGETLAEELVPDEVSDAVAAVIEDPARREAFLLARAQTVDAAERAAIGAAGEQAVVDTCQKELRALCAEEVADQVLRVSKISDELGYDVVAPRIDGSVRRLEVKTTRSTAPEVAVFLSRNEFETGRVDPDWWLVVVRAERDGKHSMLGHVSAPALAELLPTDRHEFGRWQVARVRLAAKDLVAGLPPAAA